MCCWLSRRSRPAQTYCCMPNTASVKRWTGRYCLMPLARCGLIGLLFLKSTHIPSGMHQHMCIYDHDDSQPTYQSEQTSFSLPCKMGRNTATSEDKSAGLCLHANITEPASYPKCTDHGCLASHTHTKLPFTYLGHRVAPYLETSLSNKTPISATTNSTSSRFSAETPGVVLAADLA